MHSRLAFGTIRHQRRQPQRSFTHPIAFAWLDLSEIAAIADGLLLRPYWGLLRYRREDYFGDPAIPLDQAARQLVSERLGLNLGGPVRLLAGLRSFGHCFNPVVFCYCYDERERLQAVIAEVTNTPWGERMVYVVPADEGVVDGHFIKALHVSPFQTMAGGYRLQTQAPDEHLDLVIDRVGAEAFQATLALNLRAFSRRSRAELALRFPWASFRSLLLIYLHAAVLAIRGAQYHRHL